MEAELTSTFFCLYDNKLPHMGMKSRCDIIDFI
jgi:hypothetical protein